jgi:hypothetical protein
MNKEENKKRRIVDLNDERFFSFLILLKIVKSCKITL